MSGAARPPLLMPTTRPCAVAAARPPRPHAPQRPSRLALPPSTHARTQAPVGGGLVRRGGRGAAGAARQWRRGARGPQVHWRVVQAQQERQVRPRRRRPLAAADAADDGSLCAVWPAGRPDAATSAQRRLAESPCQVPRQPGTAAAHTRCRAHPAHQGRNGRARQHTCLFLHARRGGAGTDGGACAALPRPSSSPSHGIHGTVLQRADQGAGNGAQLRSSVQCAARASLRACVVGMQVLGDDARAARRGGAAGDGQGRRAHGARRRRRRLRSARHVSAGGWGGGGGEPA